MPRSSRYPQHRTLPHPTESRLLAAFLRPARKQLAQRPQLLRPNFGRPSDTRRTIDRQTIGMIEAATTKPPAFDVILVHRFNTKVWKTHERKPEAEVVEMAVPPIIAANEFEAVQTLLKTRSPALTAPRIVSGPTLLTGICFCAACGKAMTLRTGREDATVHMLDQGAAGRNRLPRSHRADGEA